MMKNAKEYPEKVKIVVELAPYLERFVTPKAVETLTLRRILLAYINDLLSDLTIRVKSSLSITIGDNVNDFKMASYQVIINDKKCRLPLPSLVQHNAEAKELAKSILNGICRNPELFLSPSLSDTIRKQWSTMIGEELLPDMSSYQFHGLLIDSVSRYFKIDRVKDFALTIREKVRKNENSKKRQFNKVILDENAVSLGFFVSDQSPLIDTSNKISDKMIMDKQSEEKLELMRDGLWYELGITVPKIQFNIDKDLEKDEFRIQLNDLRLPPLCGLKENHFMVNETVERLKLLKISGETIFNPANNLESSQILNKNTVLKVCKEANLDIRTPLEFIILRITAEIRRNANIFLTTELVRYCLIDELKQTFPILVDCTLDYFEIEELTSILRELLEEELSIRNLREILETLIEIRAGKNTHKKQGEIIKSLRIAFKQYISNLNSKDGACLVYLLDPKIEMKLANPNQYALNPGDKDHGKLLEAIFTELGKTPSIHYVVILTTANVRGRLRKLIKKEFPELSVLCYRELSPNLRIFPVSQITQIMKNGVEQ